MVYPLKRITGCSVSFNEWEDGSEPHPQTDKTARKKTVRRSMVICPFVLLNTRIFLPLTGYANHIQSGPVVIGLKHLLRNTFPGQIDTYTDHYHGPSSAYKRFYTYSYRTVMLRASVQNHCRDETLSCPLFGFLRKPASVGLNHGFCHGSCPGIVLMIWSNLMICSKKACCLIAWSVTG